MKSLTIRIPDDEHKLMVSVAERRFMSINNMIRAHFHELARQDGLIADPAKAAQSTAAALTNAKPPAQRVPIPTEPNAWRDHIYARVQAGEKLQDVADSYGLKLADAQGMYSRAKAYIKEQPDYVPHAYTPPTTTEYTPPTTTEYTPAPDEYTPAPTPMQPEPELVYAPVDPENPTEEEQAIHAEIARRKLLALGFYV